MYYVTFELPSGENILKILPEIPAKGNRVLLDGYQYTIVQTTWNLDNNDYHSHVIFLLE